MNSFGSILRQNQGIGPGFDAARILLAIAVLAYHSPLVAYGNPTMGPFAPTGPLWIVPVAILPMFFGLSGFLVAGSAQRLNLRNFMVNRGFRILPALVAEVVLSALVLGPIFTEYSLDDYFTDQKFYTYFMNIFGFAQLSLPGVFIDNAQSNIVNGSIWTVPHEILCYIIMGIIIISGLVESGLALIGLTVIFTIANSVLVTSFDANPHHSESINLLFTRFYHGGLGPLLLPCFLLGAAGYALRDKIPFDWRLLLASIIILISTSCFITFYDWRSPSVIITLCTLMPIIYIILCFGMVKIPRIPIYHNGDYSYGIYLYGYPIQQSLYYLFPALRSSLYIFISSLVVSTLFAIFSWHVIEKPLLKFRKGFSFATRLQDIRTGVTASD